jgi:hypothetical protein
MNALELASTNGKPLEIVDFRVDLLTSPPEIQEKVIQRLDSTSLNQADDLKIVYQNPHLDEGCLNISVCKFNTGKCTIHILGKIRGQELRTEKELPESTANDPATINKRIKHVLVNSRNILKLYYLNSNVRSIENHLMAFVIAA